MQIFIPRLGMGRQKAAALVINYYNFSSCFFLCLRIVKRSEDHRNCKLSRFEILRNVPFTIHSEHSIHYIIHIIIIHYALFIIYIIIYIHVLYITIYLNMCTYPLSGFSSLTATAHGTHTERERNMKESEREGVLGNCLLQKSTFYSMAGSFGGGCHVLLSEACDWLKG